MATTICVRNLPFQLTSAEVETKMSEIGPIQSAFVVNDPKTKRSRGYAYVKFALAADAAAAVRDLHESLLGGRSIDVQLVERNNNGARFVFGDDSDMALAYIVEQILTTTLVVADGACSCSCTEKGGEGAAAESRAARRAGLL